MSDWPSDLVRQARQALDDLDGDVAGNTHPRRPGDETVLFDPVRDMQVFDALPAQARHALNYANDSYCASQVLLLAVAQEVPPDVFGAALARMLRVPL